MVLKNPLFKNILQRIGFPLLFLLLFPSSVKAIESIIINEVAWMGTQNSYNDEWIELYNKEDYPVSLEGWKIITADKSIKAELFGTVPAKGFFILERTDDSTLPEIEANLIYTGSLKNEGEHLKILDKDKNQIDELNCLSGWFAGKNKTKQTMEKTDPNLPGENPQSWQNSISSGGSPRALNVINEKDNFPEENPEPKKPENKEGAESEKEDSPKTKDGQRENHLTKTKNLTPFLLGIFLASLSALFVYFLNKRSQ